MDSIMDFFFRSRCFEVRLSHDGCYNDPLRMSPFFGRRGMFPGQRIPRLPEIKKFNYHGEVQDKK